MRGFIISAFFALMAGSAGTYLLYYTKRRNKKDRLKYLFRYTLIMTAALLSLGLLRRYTVHEDFVRYKEMHIDKHSVYSEYSFRLLEPKLICIDMKCSNKDDELEFTMINVDLDYSNKLEELLDVSGSEMVIYQVEGKEIYFPVLPAQDSEKGAKDTFYNIYPGEDPHYRSMKYLNMSVVFGILSLFLLTLGLFYTKPEKEHEEYLDLDEAVDKYLPDYYKQQELTDGRTNRYISVNDPSLYKKSEEEYGFINADMNYQPIRLSPEKEKADEKPFIVRSAEDIFDPSLKSEEDILDARDDLLIKEARRSREKHDAKF